MSLTMCPIYLDADGNPSFPSVEATNDAGFCLDSPDLLANFDFDSFLRDTDDTVDFPKSAFLFGPDECKDNGTTDNHEFKPSAPMTPAHPPTCLPLAQTEVVPIEMEQLQQSCQILGQDYLKQIVCIHIVCKNTVGLTYPDVLQNQLFTASLTLNKLGDLVSLHHETVAEWNLLAALEALVFECRCRLGRISEEEGLAGIVQNPNMRQVSIKRAELIAYDCLVPLLNVLRAFTCKSPVEQKARLQAIAATHLINMDIMHDCKTDADDKQSILSGKTLLEVQEVKEKDLKVEVDEVEEEEEIEASGCFLRMFFQRNKRQAKSREKMTLKSRMIAVSSRLVTEKVASLAAARQRKSACKLHEEVLGLCTFGTVADLTKLLSRNRRAVAAIEAKPDQFLRELASRSPGILKCVLTHCRALDINKAGKKGRTCLWNAARNGNTEVMVDLIAAGANKETADKNGLRPLHIAVKNGHLASVAALLTAGADIEAPDVNLNKPLHYAAEHISGYEMIDKLLDAGAAINATNNKLTTPLYKAIRLGRSPAQRLLMRRGADIEALRVRWETPVIYAVSHGQLDMLCNLINVGADPDVLTCENRSALHSAAAHQDPQIVQALLDAGCNVNTRGKNGSTPLYVAARNGRIKNAQVLASHGADLNAKRKGLTPIDIARKHRNFGVVEVLEKVTLGLQVGELEKNLEDHADHYWFTWEQWFERYTAANVDWI